MNISNDEIKKAFSLFNEKKFEESKLIFLNLIKDTKFDKRIYFMLYEIYSQLNDIKNAKKYLINYVEYNNKNHIAFNALANIYFKSGEIQLAEKNYLKAIGLKNDFSVAIINLAVLYEGIGDKNNAQKFYEVAINLSPKDLSIYYNLNKVNPKFINEEKIKFISETLKDEKLEPFSLAAGFFLLAGNERKKKNINKEIENLKLAHQYAFKDKLNINRLSRNYFLNIISKIYNKIDFEFEEKIPNNIRNLKPIFIIGLPRSGSTILEAILSSGKKKILNLGETNLINWLIASTRKEIISKLDANLICNKLILALANLGVSHSKNNIFIDKSLENFFYIDLILKIFPKAKFINTVRNTNDNIFAIFQQFLSNISWTHSLEDILDYTDNYLKIIKYFKKKYPDKIFSVKLEDLTTNKEKISKEIYSFCELEWDKKALEYYTRKDLYSSTASNIQIRSNLHKYNHDKYKLYKHLLKNFADKYDWLNE